MRPESYFGATSIHLPTVHVLLRCICLKCDGSPCMPLLLQVSFEEFRIRTAQMYRQFGKLPDSGSDRSPLRLVTFSGSTAPPGDKSGELASANHSEVANDLASQHNKEERDTSKTENNIEKSADQFASNVVDHAVVTAASEENAKEPGRRTEASQRHEGHVPSAEKEQIQLTPPIKPLGTDGTGRPTFSPTPRAPAFTIPEFRWSTLHVKLLADLFLLFEKEMEGWKM